MGSFTPLVFGTYGGMGADCNCFLKRLAEKLLEKNEEPYHITILLGLVRPIAAQALPRFKYQKVFFYLFNAVGQLLDRYSM